MHFATYQSILSQQNGMNLYRGCTHGCIYCDARSKCYQMQHAFTDIEVKENAPELLEDAIKRKRQKCMIGTGAMSDPYLHLETELGYTRRCLELIATYGFGLSIQTKSNRILRDLDLLLRIHAQAKCVVQMTLTTHDTALCRILEPDVSTTQERVEVLRILQANGIPTIVWLCPILPYINDTEENLRGLLEDCVRVGVYGIINFGMGLTLREGNREYFYEQLDRHFPGMKQRYIRRYQNAYACESDNAPALRRLLLETCRRTGICCDNEALFTYLHTFEDKLAGQQLSLF